MEQENVRLSKEAQQREGKVNEEELKKVAGDMEYKIRDDIPHLGLIPLPAFKMDEMTVKFDMEGKPSKNLSDK